MPAQESPIELPDGWALALLGDVVQPSKEKIDPQSVPDLPYLSLEHIEAHSRRIVGQAEARDATSTKAVFHAGDVLYGKLRPYLNKVCRPDFEGVCSTDILVFPERPELDSRYLLYFLNRPEVVEATTHAMAGVNLPRVSFKTLGGLGFPFPPLAEQRRIADGIDNLLQNLDAARERLARLIEDRKEGDHEIPSILKRFRQSVLAAACSGQFTALFREDHADLQPPRTRDADDVRDVDLGELRQQLDIPEAWKWSRLGDCLEDLRYGTSVKCTFEGEGVPVLRVPNIASGELDLNALKHGPMTARQLESLRLRQGDVIVCRTNGSLDLVGKAAVFGNISGDYAFASYLIRLRTDSSALLPEYLHLVLSAPLGRDQIEQRASTTAGQYNLNREILRNLLLPVPPLQEQRELVQAAHALLALANRIEHRVALALRRAERLTLGILWKAFQGELVSTDADLARAAGQSFESGDELLERIQHTQDAQPNRQKTTRSATVGAKAWIRSAIMRKLSEIKPTHLQDILTPKRGGATPEDLLLASELEVDDFYTQLKREVEAGKVKERRKGKTTVLLEAVS